MEFQKIAPSVFKPEKPGDTVEGTLVTVEDGKKYGGKVYHLQTTSNDQLVVFSTTVLQDRMNYVKVGEYCKIVYNGTQKNAKGQETKLFDVFKAKLEGEEAPVTEAVQATAPVTAEVPVQATAPITAEEPVSVPAPVEPSA